MTMMSIMMMKIVMDTTIGGNWTTYYVYMMSLYVFHTQRQLAATYLSSYVFLWGK